MVLGHAPGMDYTRHSDNGRAGIHHKASLLLHLHTPGCEGGVHVPVATAKPSPFEGGGFRPRV